jgi:hypothetical protein
VPAIELVGTAAVRGPTLSDQPRQQQVIGLEGLWLLLTMSVPPWSIDSNATE